MKKDKLDNDKVTLLYQFIKFGFVGVSNTIISLIVYYLCLHLGMNYIFANICSFLAGVINSYYWNSKYVFNKQNNNKKIGSILRVFLSYGITLVISTVLLIAWIDILGISDKIAPLINLIITIPLNFVLNKYWVFK